MKKEDIYVGTLMKCVKYENYLKDGERTFVPDFEIGHMKTGHFEYNSRVIKETAMFLKKDDGYICLDTLKNGVETILVNMGFDINVIYTTPCCDDDYYVLKDSLVPYYSENLKKDVYVKSIKRHALLDPRIKGGIEH